MIPRGERRLAGLDGIQGLAALFVVVNHIFLRVFAALFEIPVRWRRSPSGALRHRLPRPQQAPA